MGSSIISKISWATFSLKLTKHGQKKWFIKITWITPKIWINYVTTNIDQMLNWYGRTWSSSSIEALKNFYFYVNFKQFSRIRSYSFALARIKITACRARTGNIWSSYNWGGFLKFYFHLQKQKITKMFSDLSVYFFRER